MKNYVISAAVSLLMLGMCSVAYSADSYRVWTVSVENPGEKLASICLPDEEGYISSGSWNWSVHNTTDPWAGKVETLGIWGVNINGIRKSNNQREAFTFSLTPTDRTATTLKGTYMATSSSAQSPKILKVLLKKTETPCGVN